MITQDEAKIKASDLRIGNYVYLFSDPIKVTPLMIVEQHQSDVAESEYLKPIPLSEDLLLRLGFEKPSTYTVVLTYNLNLGRKRSIAVSAVGTPNEMVFIREGDGNEKDDLIVVRNYDYDGKTYLHHIQNIAYDFGQELTLKP